MQLGKLQKIEADLKQLGFGIVAISADRPEKLQETVQKHMLTYTLLSDARMLAARAYGIAFQLDAAMVERYRGYSIDLEAASGETHHLLPVPSVFLVDAGGVIRYAYSNADYKVRIPTDDLLAAATELAAAGE